MSIDKKAFSAAIDVLSGEFPPESGISIEVLRRLCTVYEAAKAAEQPDEKRISYHETCFDQMRDIFLLESLRCAGLNLCEPELWMGICRSAMKRLCKRESGDEFKNDGKLNIIGGRVRDLNTIKEAAKAPISMKTRLTIGGPIASLVGYCQSAKHLSAKSDLKNWGAGLIENANKLDEAWAKYVD